MLSALLQLSRSLDFEAVAWTSVPDPEALRGAIRAAVALGVATSTAEALIRRCEGRADARVTVLIRDLFRRPEHYTSTQFVLQTLQLTTATVNRLLRVAGLVSLERLRSAARIARAYPLLARRRLSTAQCAKVIRCGSDDTLWRACKEVTGLTPARLRDDCTPEMLQEMIVRYATDSTVHLPEIAEETVLPVSAMAVPTAGTR
jgi:AraC-like DNA-binding protein